MRYFILLVVVFLFENNACKGFEPIDAGILLQSFMLSAYAHYGLATCPIGYVMTTM